MADFTNQSHRARKDSLGPVTLNQAQDNVRFVDNLMRMEHNSSGEHNAVEIPLVLGHLNNVATPAYTDGFLFDLNFMTGAPFTRSGGLTDFEIIDSYFATDQRTGTEVPLASVIGNVSDSAITTKPHTISTQLLWSAGYAAVRTCVNTLVSTSGNTWSREIRAHDIAVHVKSQALSHTELTSNLVKHRRDYLSDDATDWNALVTNQAQTRKILNFEHTTAGEHNVDRIAKATGWFLPSSGPSYISTALTGVTSVSRISAGVVEVTLSGTLASTDLAACFADALPTTNDELLIINGRCHSTTKFRFYIWKFDFTETSWTTVDRPFYASMYGRWA